MTRSCEPDPPFDFLLALFLDADDALTVLPTHRVVRGLGEDGLARLRAGLDDLFEVAPTTAEALVDRFERGGRARRWRGTVRARDAGPRVAPDRAPRGVRAAGRRPAARRCAGWTSRSSRRRSRPWPGSTPRRSRAASGSAIRSPRPRPSRWSRPASTAPTPRSCSSRRPSRSILDVVRRGRRHAPEVDLFLSQGPHRARVQPARVVGNDRTDDRPDHLRAPPRPHRAVQRPARPQGRDRDRRPRPVHRVVAARAAVAAQAGPVRPRRARRIVGLGALPPPLRRPRLGGPRAQPAQPLLVRRPPTRRRSTSAPTPRTSSRRWSASVRRPSWSGTGSAACWCSRPSSACPRPRTC